MKKLAINALNICDNISNIDSYLLVIKNKKILYKILSNSDLQYENSYIQILDENYKELKLSDYVDFISSIINLDSNSKKNLNVLIRRIKKEEIEILRSTSEKINEILEECAKQIKINSPINISYDIEVDEDDIIKLLSISLQDDSPDLIERINNYINISFELRGIKIIDIENVEFKTSIFDHIKILDEDICVI